MTTPTPDLPKADRAHDWFEWHGVPCCKVCGIVKRRDGKNNPCKGPVKIAPREQPSAPAAPVEPPLVRALRVTDRHGYGRLSQRDVDELLTYIDLLRAALAQARKERDEERKRVRFMLGSLFAGLEHMAGEKGAIQYQVRYRVYKGHQRREDDFTPWFPTPAEALDRAIYLVEISNMDEEV